MLLFIDLYRFAQSEEGEYVPFDALSHKVVTEHNRVGSVQLYPCELEEDISLGHTVLIPESVRENCEALDCVQIRYASHIHEFEKRFVWTKELMHVFDDHDAVVDTPEKLLTLLTELESRPLSNDASAMLRSEDDAEWMAILVLCPPRLRQPHLERLISEQTTIGEIAQSLRMPEWAVRPAMGDYYGVALEKLTGESLQRKRRRRTNREP